MLTDRERMALGAIFRLARAKGRDQRIPLDEVEFHPVMITSQMQDLIDLGYVLQTGKPAPLGACGTYRLTAVAVLVAQLNGCSE